MTIYEEDYADPKSPSHTQAGAENEQNSKQNSKMHWAYDDST